MIGDEAVLGDKYLKRPFVQPKKLKTGASKEGKVNHMLNHIVSHMYYEMT